MRQRHVILCLYGIAWLWVILIFVAVYISTALKPEKSKFVDPVIWRDPPYPPQKMRDI